MTTTQHEIDRISPTLRPNERAIGYQNWHRLLFVHWQVPADILRPLIPSRLSIDTFDGTAWVGLVPFAMTGVRPWWSFPLPGISAFLETNVRTYVHREGKAPGVWFFSLDAANSLAVHLARRLWHLNYFRADMSLSREENRIEYESQRRWPEPRDGHCRIKAAIGDPMASTNAGRAEPGTLEYFLCERYLLYATDHQGRLYRGQVHHKPYPLQTAELLELDETMLSAAGIDAPGEPVHVLFSEGVDVEIFKLRRI